VPAEPRAEGGLYTSAVVNERTHELIVKAINNSATSRSAEIVVGGANASGEVTVTTLGSGDLNVENSFEHPKAVAPEMTKADVRNGVLKVELGAYSVNIYRIAMR
jgi:alpha-N-arabinofuranosidase